MEAGATGTTTFTGPSRGALHALPISCCIHSQAMSGLEALRCCMMSACWTWVSAVSHPLINLILLGQISFCQSLSTCMRGYAALCRNCDRQLRLPGHALDHSVGSTSCMHCCTGCWSSTCRRAGDAIAHLIALLLTLA